MKEIDNVSFDELADKYCSEKFPVYFVKRVKGVLKRFF